jgi:hypothetical protein
LRTHLWRQSLNNPWIRRHRCDQLWSLQEILTENFNMRDIAPSSRRAHPHAPENHRVCDKQQHGNRSPSSLLARLSPSWFCIVPQTENETEGMTFWNSVWHQKGIARGTWQH